MPALRRSRGGRARELIHDVEVEYFASGTTIFRQGEADEHVRVVRRGSVELLDQGRVLDVLGEELFGHASMLSGLPTGFEARARRTPRYRLPADAVVPSPEAGRPALRRPQPVRRAEAGPASLSANVDPAQQHAASLIRGEPLVCEPDVTLREAARRMSQSGNDAALIRLDEEVGILTDRDLRTVVADGVARRPPSPRR